MDRALSVLIVEISDTRTEPLVAELHKTGHIIFFTRVDCPEALLIQLREQVWDIVLASDLPNFSGIDALKIVQNYNIDIPVIIISDVCDIAVALEAIKAGAHDYISKSDISRLSYAIERELNEIQTRLKLKETEEDLRVSETKFSKAFMSSPEIVTINELNTGRYVDVNDSFVRELEYTREEVIGRTTYDINLWVDTSQRTNLIQMLKKGKLIREHETKFRSKSGRLLTVLISADVVEINNKDCILAIISDITERKIVEQEREELLNRLHLLLESTDQGIYGLDTEGRCTFINRSALQMLGYTADELIGQFIHDIIHGEKPYPPEECPIYKAYKAGQGSRITNEIFHRKDGTPFDVDYSFYPIHEDGDVKGAVIAFSDITQRKRAEEALREEKDFISAVLDTIGALVVVLSKDGHIIRFNKTCEQITGYTIDEVKGKYIWDMLHLPEEIDTAKSAFSKIAMKDLPSQFENHWIAKNGELRLIQWRNTGIADNNDIKYIIEAGIDITQQRETEQELDSERRRLRAVLDALPVGVFIADAKGSITEYNNQAAIIWGGPPPMPHSISEYNKYEGWWPNTGKKIKQNEWTLARTLQKGETIVGEIVNIKRFDGSYGTIMNSSAPILDAEGNIIGGVLTEQDVTEQIGLRDALERALHETEHERERVAALESITTAGISGLEMEKVVGEMAKRMAELLNTFSCTILLLDQEKNELTVKGSYGVKEQIGHKIKTNEGFAGRVYTEKHTLYVEDAQENPLVKRPYIKRLGIHSLLGTPLIAHKKVQGVVHVDTKEIRHYSDDELRLFESMAARISSSIENARLYEEVKNSRKKVEEALEREKQSSLLLQRALLPGKPPVINGYDIALIYNPAFAETEIGGDFYDVFRVSDKVTGILIGDVSGKGLGAASLAATTRSTIHAYAHETADSGDVLTKANSVLADEEAEFGSFVTVFLVMLNQDTGDVWYASGGHPPAFAYHTNGTIETFEIGAPPLALIKNLCYQSHKSSLQPGDKLILYTDGINEARRNSALFDTTGIERILEQYGCKPPKELSNKILQAATEWACGNLTDDAAIVIIERAAE